LVWIGPTRFLTLKLFEIEGEIRTVFVIRRPFRCEFTGRDFPLSVPPFLFPVILVKWQIPRFGIVFP
jgi:hypothetical protein